MMLMLLTIINYTLPMLLILIRRSLHRRLMQSTCIAAENKKRKSCNIEQGEERLAIA